MNRFDLDRGESLNPCGLDGKDTQKSDGGRQDFAFWTLLSRRQSKGVKT